MKTSQKIELDWAHTLKAIKIYYRISKLLNNIKLEQKTKKEVLHWLEIQNRLDRLCAVAYWKDTKHINSLENCMNLTAEGTINYLERIGVIIPAKN